MTHAPRQTPGPDRQTIGPPAVIEQSPSVAAGLSRRGWLAGTGAGAVGMALGGPVQAALLRKGAAGASGHNPIATSEQRAMEETALRIMARPELIKARASVALLWRNVVAWPLREQMASFDDMIEEYVFNFVMRAVNSDAAYPKVMCIMQPAHRWFGHDIPGSRWGGDSPDFTYRIIPIAHGGRYEVRGQATCAQPPSATYTLMRNMPDVATVGMLDSLDMDIAADGSFVITIDGQADAGGSNHLQTRPGPMHLLVRDALGDWLTQTPNALQVTRLDAAGRPPLNDADLAAEAVRQMTGSVYYVYYTSRSGAGQPPNMLRPPASSAAFGGMATQWASKGNLMLGADEALIVTANASGARFRNVSLCDMFFRSLNYWTRTGSLNMTQMVPDADGRFTYVIAHRDPGAHNWLDTGGLEQSIFGHRWQAFSRGSPHVQPTLDARVVKFAQLDHALPPGVRRIDAAGRREQLSRREAGYRRRFIES